MHFAVPIYQGHCWTHQYAIHDVRCEVPILRKTHHPMSAGGCRNSVVRHRRLLFPSPDCHKFILTTTVVLSGSNEESSLPRSRLHDSFDDSVISPPSHERASTIGHRPESRLVVIGYPNQTTHPGIQPPFATSRAFEAERRYDREEREE